jgi:hypothetical protein
MSTPSLEAQFREIFSTRLSLAARRQTKISGRCRKLGLRIESSYGHPYWIDETVLQQIYNNPTFSGGAALGPVARGASQTPYLFRFSGTQLGGATFIPQGRIRSPRNLYTDFNDWTNLGDFYHGSVGFRLINFWSSYDLGALNPRRYSDVARALLSVGLYRGASKYLLLRVDAKAIRTKPRLPTELDGLLNFAFYPVPFSTPNSGLSLDLGARSPDPVHPEYVLVDVPSNLIQFKPVMIDEAQFQEFVANVKADARCRPANEVYKDGLEIAVYESLVPKLSKYYASL